MEHPSANDILSRIEWCRLQRKGAVTRDEEEGWYAEEAGLIDALLGRDQAGITHPSLLERYKLGLQDGQALIRLLQPATGWLKAIMEGLEQVASRQQTGSAKVPVSPSARSSKVHDERAML